VLKERAPLTTFNEDFSRCATDSIQGVQLHFTISPTSITVSSKANIQVVNSSCRLTSLPCKKAQFPV